jgi:butyrate kinase
VNNALNGEGPFSPERSGTLPAFALAKACFSGKYTLADIKAMIAGKGGLVALMGTNSFLEVEKREEAGDPEAIFFTQAYVYNVAKYIGAAATVLSGKVDAILITGGIAYGKKLCEDIKARVGFIAPVFVYPGEDEMAALAGNAQAVLDGQETPKEY